ncbi:unnamed protein product, partial [Cyprideis torosa]
MDESRVGGNAAVGVPGALSNQPPGPSSVPEQAGAGEGGADAVGAPGSARKQATRNYELDRTISYTKHQQGRVRRLTVAVVVDDLSSINPESGEAVRTPWDQNELQRLRILVQDAVGFSALRGDSVNVVNTPFVAEEPIVTEDAPIWKQDWIWDIVKQAMAVIFVLVLVFGILRPILRNLATAGTAGNVAGLGAAGDVSAELAGLDGADFSSDSVTFGSDDELLPTPNESFDYQLNAIRSMVAEDPARVAQAVKQWVDQGGGEIDKAAILLISLGETDAAEILKHMGPKEVQMIGEAMAQLNNVPQTKVESVIGDFMGLVSDQTGIGINNDIYIRSMLNQALGEEKAKTLLDRILMSTNTSGLDTLRWMEPRQIAEIIRYEHPQIQAVVVAYLEPDAAAGVLGCFDEKQRLDILMRVAALDRIQPQALQELNDILERQFAGAGGSSTATLGGVKSAANIMNFIDSSIEVELMESIKESDEYLASSISDLMFVFDNLLDVEDMGIQAILREVSTDVLVVALKGADVALQDKVFKNMSKRAAELLKDDLEAKGPVRVSDVEGAQKEVLTIARKLADDGEIILGGGGEAMV